MLQEELDTNKCQRFVWDSLNDMRLVRMRDEQGYTFPRIAELLGVPSAKICRTRYYKVQPEAEAITQGRPYTRDEIEQFKKLYLQKTPMVSTLEISKIMGRSKNAICGLRKRLGLQKRPSVAVRGQRNPYGAPPNLKRLDGKPRAPKRNIDQSELSASLKKIEDATGHGFKDGGKTFAQLTSQCCRFIHGDPKHGDHRFCGATTEKKSWCAFHHKIVYRDDVRKV